MISFVLGVKVWSRKDVKAATFCNANNYYFYRHPPTSLPTKVSLSGDKLMRGACSNRVFLSSKSSATLRLRVFFDFFGKKRNLSIVCPLRLISRQSNPVCIISDNLNSYQNICKIKPVLRDNLTVGLQIKVEPVI